MINGLQPRLHTSDLSRAVAFYVEILGFSVGAEFEGFALLEREGIGLQIGGPLSRTASQPSTCTLYFDVDDANAMHAALSSKIAIEWGPEDFPYGRREFAIRDPDDNLVIISQQL